MNYNTLRNKPTINYRELIGDSTILEVGGITKEEFNTLMNTDLASYYTKAQIDELFARSFVYREKSGSIVTFDCPSSITTGISSVTSEIVAVQSGTGDPSPTNVRPISGWSAVNVVVSPTTDVADGTTYTTTLKDGQGNPMTCYGGQLVNENGVQRLANTDVAVDMGDLNWTYQALSGDRNGFTASISDLKEATSGSDLLPAISSCYKPVRYNDTWANGVMSYFYPTGKTIIVINNDYTDATAFKTAMTGQKIVYELATPIEIPQDNLPISTQDGTNNLWADSGDVTVTALDKIIQG